VCHQFSLQIVSLHVHGFACFCFVRMDFMLLSYMYPSAAYKYGDGKKIDGKRVLVDVERGRTVKGWLPRKLGK
jgi:hypothetical protein